MSAIFDVAAITAVLAGTVRLSVPLLLAGLGETLDQRSGVLNLGIDGIMLMGAFTGYYMALHSGGAWAGAMAGLAVGALLGLASAFIAVTLGAEQGISGIGVYLFGLGMSDLLFQKLVGTPVPAPSFAPLEIPLLSKIPVAGEVLFSQPPIVYIVYALVPALTWMISSTTFGMNMRAVGENPAAADSLGVSVTRVRYLAVTSGGALAGLAGAALALDLHVFQQNLTNGAGFIAVALVYFGAWKPSGVMAGAVLYGFMNALVLQLKARGIIPLEGSDLAAMAPAVVTIAALALVASRYRQPAALTKPFVREG
jgi:simple sugar transport system permease protein